MQTKGVPSGRLPFFILMVRSRAVGNANRQVIIVVVREGRSTFGGVEFRESLAIRMPSALPEKGEKADCGGGAEVEYRSGMDSFEADMLRL